VQITFRPSSPPSAARRGGASWGLRPLTPICTKPISAKYNKDRSRNFS
jgi:hypothetical protein